MQLVEFSTSPLKATSDKVLSGLFAEMDVFNQNGRRYPEEIYEQAYEELLPKIQDRRLLGELDHPIDYDEVRLSNVSHVITECHIDQTDDGKKVYGTVELLDTPAGMIAQSLVKAGINLGISSRGVGATRQVRDGSEVSQLKLITYDLVAEPSFANAVLTPSQSSELSDSLSYIESKLPLNESIESESIRGQIKQIRESLINRKTNPTKEIIIDDKEIKSLRSLLESTQETVKNDTVLMSKSRQQIKFLQEKLSEAEERNKHLMENMFKLQEAYNDLSESGMTLEERDQLLESIIDLKKRLAVEKRGMSYSSVSKILEGAQTEEDIEDRLNSLASMRKSTQSKIILENLQTMESESKSLGRLASIVSQV